MFDLAHPFDPKLKPEFSEALCAKAQTAPFKPRRLFYRLMHIHENPATLAEVYWFLQRRLQSISELYADQFIDTFQLGDFSAQLQKVSLLYVAPTLDKAQRCCWLTGISPLMLTDACWLPAVSQAATSQEPLAIALMAIHLRFIEHTVREHYDAALLLEGIRLPAVHSLAYSASPAIPESMFEFAALQLSLAQFPRVFFPELLGFTWAYCQADLWQVPDDYVGDLDFSVIRRRMLSAELSEFESLIQHYLDQFADQSQACWRRIQSGILLYRHQFKTSFDELTRQVNNIVSPEEHLSRIIAQKAQIAFGHHHNIELAGKSLDAWFNEPSFESAAFLEALRQSHWVDQYNPLNSRLLKLFDFNGPMFGVFDVHEISVLRAWLGNLADSSITTPKINLESESPPTHCSSATLHKKPDHRTLFHTLVNSELYPEILPVARKHVEQILRWSRWTHQLPFKHYQPEVFEQFIQHLYQREVAAHQPLELPPKLSKSTYLWGIEQFAPTILTDGCWLQHIRQPNVALLQELGSGLRKIYVDEVGAGMLHQNHPFIYSQLLQSVDLNLPPVHTRKFANHSGFLNSAFDIPIYLMAISHFPNAFLPELLGLNMAIELSGLGRSYMRLAQALRYWGIDPAIVNLHISIDNLASGHAALAKEVIQRYLDAVLMGHGNEEMQRHWRRVYWGYKSLETASLRFALALATQYWLKKRN